MVWLGIQYALREGRRSVVTLIGIAGALMLAVFLIGVYRGALHGSLDYIAHTEADIWVGRRGSWNLMRNSGLLPGSLRQELLAVPSVTRVEPILAALLPAWLAGEPRTLLVIGLPPQGNLATPRRIDAGRPLPRPGEVVIDRAFARRSGLGLGDTLDLAGRRLRIAGVAAGTNLLVTQYAFVSAGDLASLLGIGDQSSFFLVETAPGSAAQVKHAITTGRPAVAAFTADVFLENNHREVSSGFLPVLLAIATLGMIVGSLVVGLNLYIAVLEKRREFALVAALGGSAATRSLIVLQQALTVALGGGIAGLLLLAVLERLLPFLVPEIEFHLSPLLGLAALAAILGLAFAGAVVPARLAGRVPPMEALKQ
jgi:putative ABC transport system permease protein